jgi:hypothetical protein
MAVGAVVLLVLAGRAALRSFGTETTLSDGARAYASCKAPWRSARASPPADRFTLWVMTGGTGQRRAEGVAVLGSRCQAGARRRLAAAAALLTGSAVLTGLALRFRSTPAAPTPPADPVE